MNYTCSKVTKANQPRRVSLIMFGNSLLATRDCGHIYHLRLSPYWHVNVQCSWASIGYIKLKCIEMRCTCSTNELQIYILEIEYDQHVAHFVRCVQLRSNIYCFGQSLHRYSYSRDSGLSTIFCGVFIFNTLL